MNRSQIDFSLCQACTVLGLTLLNLAKDHSILTKYCIFNNLEMSVLVSHQSAVIVFFAVVKPYKRIIVTHKSQMGEGECQQMGEGAPLPYIFSVKVTGLQSFTVLFLSWRENKWHTRKGFALHTHKISIKCIFFDTSPFISFIDNSLKNKI